MIDVKLGIFSDDDDDSDSPAQEGGLEPFGEEAVIRPDFGAYHEARARGRMRINGPGHGNPAAPTGTVGRDPQQASGKASATFRPIAEFNLSRHLLVTNARTPTYRPDGLRAVLGTAVDWTEDSHPTVTAANLANLLRQRRALACEQ